MIGETGKYINGYAFKPEDWSGRGKPIIRIQNLTNPDRPPNRTEVEVPSAIHVSSGDLLVSWSATLDAYVWRGEPAVLNQHIFRVVPDTGLMNSGLLYHWLRVAIRDLARSAHSHGSTMAHINRGPFLAHELPLPPMGEQRRIAETLDELLTDLTSAEMDLLQAKRKLALYRQSLLKSAVEGTLTAEWRRGEPTSAWTSATIGELAEVGTGVTPLRSNARYFSGGTIPWVTSGALNAPVVRAASEFVTEAALAECRLTMYPPGTLLVAMYGEGKTRGKCAELAITAAINQAVAAVVLRPAFEDRRAFLKAFLWHSYETMRQQASGGVQPNLNLQIIKNIRVPLPPVDEQQVIVRHLDELQGAVKAQEDALNHALALATAQRQNILRAAFSGQLVPQDPNDEPAGALLERIRAVRQRLSSQPAQARRTRRAAC